jgi:hypothetical protein
MAAAQAERKSEQRIGGLDCANSATRLRAKPLSTGEAIASDKQQQW